MLFLRRIFIACSLWLLFAGTCCAQVSFTFTDKNAKSCEDFATNVLNDPWDMSSSSDINNYFKDVDIQHFTNPRFTGGQFLGTTSDVASYFYLFSPEPGGAFSIGGRWGPRIGFDSTKYTRFSMKFSTDTSDPYGVRMIWDRGQNYANNRNIVFTGQNIYHTGNNVISVDLTSNSLSTTTKWVDAPVTGLAIIPTTLSGTNVAVDWIRLEDPTTCSGGGFTPQSLSYTAAASGNDNLMSLYLVEDGVTNPLVSGYARKLSSSATPANGSASITDSLGIFPGKYRTIAILDSDFATLELDNPWDFNDITDLFDVNNSLPGLSSTSFSNGVLSGTSTSGKVLLKAGTGFDRSKYKFITIKGTFTSAPGIVGPGGYQASTSAGGGYYTIDLSGVPSWSGTESNYLQVVIPNGNFSIDFVSLRKSGFDTGFNRSAATLLSDVTYKKIGAPSSATVTINTPPSFDIKTPNERGGEALRAWNMNDGDFNVYSNLASGTDPSFPNEKLVSYLPDVRAIDGVRGDFFKGTNIDGNDDPDNYSTFPFASFNKFTFDSAEYKNLCFRLLIDRDFSLGTGSVGRVIWLADGPFYISEDLPLITDNWSGSRWYNYCVDMTELYTDGTTQNNWSGTIKAFRIDAHEFTPQTTYYFDWIKLRKDFRAPGVFSVSYEASDVDNDPITLTFYASATKNTLGTAIPGASFVVPNSSRVYNLDTTGLANGTYYINATASDGVNNPVVRYGQGRVVVDNAGSQGTAPVLSLEAPVVAATYCDSLQVKGYSLQTDRLEDVSSVEVLIDGVWLTNIYPDIYSANAKTAYPTSDSSNSGFNQLIDISSVAPGSHTATIIAHSTKGLSTTLTRSFINGSSGCTTPITDPGPSGAPVVVNVSTTPTPKPTATPAPNQLKVSSARHSRTGIVTVSLSSVPSSYKNCKATLYVKSDASAGYNKLSSGSIGATEVSKKQIRFKTSGATVSSTGPSSVLISNTVTCGSKTTAQSAGKLMKVSRGKTGAKTYASFVKALAKLKKY